MSDGSRSSSCPSQLGWKLWVGQIFSHWTSYSLGLALGSILPLWLTTMDRSMNLSGWERMIKNPWRNAAFCVDNTKLYTLIVRFRYKVAPYVPLSTPETRTTYSSSEFSQINYVLSEKALHFSTSGKVWQPYKTWDSSALGYRDMLWKYAGLYLRSLFLQHVTAVPIQEELKVNLNLNLSFETSVDFE